MIALIHGYGTGRSLARSARTHGGFQAFEGAIIANEAKVFFWFTLSKDKKIQNFNPLFHLSLYLSERERAKNYKTLENFNNFLLQNSITHIVAHSLGCYLVMNYLQFFELPDFVHRISFIQADFSQDDFLISSSLQKRLFTKKMYWVNYYCPWDNALICSFTIHHTPPVGLVGWKSEFIINKLFPLWKRINLHTSSINDEKLFIDTITAIP